MKFLIPFLLIASTVSAQNLPDNACQALKDIRSRYGTTLFPNCEVAGQSDCPLGVMLNEAALKSGLGLARKESGYFVVSPVGKIASDILMTKDKVAWDVFINSGTETKVNCGKSIGVIDRPYVEPIGDIPPPPVDTCKEQLKACNNSNIDLKNSNTDLKNTITILQADNNTKTIQINDLTIRINTLQETNKVLETKNNELQQSLDNVKCSANIFGIKIPCKVIK